MGNYKMAKGNKRVLKRLREKKADNEDNIEPGSKKIKVNIF